MADSTDEMIERILEEHAGAWERLAKMEPRPFYETGNTADAMLNIIPGEVLEAPEMEAGLMERIEQLEDALLVVVQRMAVLERKMEAINGESSTSEM